MVNEELYLFEMHKPASFIFGNDLEELQNLISCRATDSSALACVGVTKTHLITFAQGGQSFDRLRAVSLPFEVAEMIKGVDKRGVQRIVLLRRRAPEQEGVQIKGDVLVEKRDSKVGFVLGNEDAVIVRQARPDYGHNAIVANVATWTPNARKRRMPNRRSVEAEDRVVGSVLDELGLDRQATLELKLKAASHQKILQLVKRRGYRARDLERILRIQQPRVSEMMRGKLSTLSVARLLLYADLLGAEAEVKLKKARAHAAA